MTYCISPVLIDTVRHQDYFQYIIHYLSVPIVSILFSAIISEAFSLFVTKREHQQKKDSPCFKSIRNEVSRVLLIMQGLGRDYAPTHV